MHRLNSDVFHVDLMRTTGVLARIESVDSIGYSEEIDGDFSCTITIQGSVQMKPSGFETSDAVGIILGAILSDVSDSDIEIVFNSEGEE